MDKNFEEKYHRYEQDYWWFVARRDFIRRLLASYGTAKDASILEVGCSGGPLLASLREFGYACLTGIDISKVGIERCGEKGIRDVYVMNGAKTTFADDSFDLVIASDILEHIEDDAAGLKEWRRILKPNGTIIVFVPAFQFLWSGHDVVNKHFRRYTRPRMRDLMREAGFTVKRSSYWNVTAFLPALLVRAVQNLRSKKPAEADQMYGFNNIINGIFVGILKAENRILSVANAPFGVSVFTVGVKADNS